MAGLINLTSTPDTSGLNRAVAVARQYNRRTPAVASNVAALYVARQARVETDKLSVPMARIDTELTVDVQPVLVTRGKRAGLPLKSGRKKVTAMTGGLSKVSGVPFTWLLVGARAKSGSRYNRLTGNRYMLGPDHPFKGQKPSQFAAIMAGLVQKMVSTRHKATGFLQAGWIAAIAKAATLVPSKYYRGGESAYLPNMKRVNVQLGDFTAAQEGQLSATCTVENDIGLSGENAVLDAARNQALLQIGTPPLQAAIAIQANKTFTYIAEQEAKEAFRPLAAHGVSYSG